MLVLSRKIGQRLVLTGGITILISRVAGNRVTIAIDAPDDVRILRGECQPHEQQKPEGEEGRAA